MTFKEVSWEDPSLFRENMVGLGYNIFKIKYFYEVDQLKKLSIFTSNPSSRDFLIEGYMKAADEAMVYLKTIDAFLAGDANLPEDKQHFQWLLEYFSVKEEHLLSFELEDEEGFSSWLIHRE